MIAQVKELCDFLFNDNQKIQIKEIVKEIEENPRNYRTDKLWKFDQSIGGIGGYCINPDPCKQLLFQGQNLRNTYRCLQYARANIEITDVLFTSRQVVQQCGLCLEECLKLVVMNGFVSELVNSKKTFGQLVNTVMKKCFLDEKIIKKLEMFIPIYNISKHGILTNIENNEIKRTFSIEDAIVTYLICRMIVQEIMLVIDREHANFTYEINYGDYSKDIKKTESLFEKWSEKDRIVGEEELKVINNYKSVK
jgi:hypothetical protein